MQTADLDARATAEAGFAALRRGDARGARVSFERLAATGKADAGLWLGLAQACRAEGDQANAIAAAERALALEPRNLRALLFKADHFAQAGDARAASAFYMFTVQTAQAAGALPHDLHDEIARAQRMCDHYAGQFETFLRDRLGAAGMSEGDSSERFRQSLDILLGKRKVYHQQPQTYYFPELPQIQFFDRRALPWLDPVEAATSDIRAELEAVMREPAAFKPYVEGDPRRPRRERSGMTDNPDWGAFYLWKFGELVPENAARCPKTLAALAEVPLVHVPQRSPSILFSLLRPGARIPPHTGLVNTRMICHLPLLVPPGCALRVGNETRTPIQGKAWAFDDTMEHEAWNESDRTRVILLFEAWRPELRDDERALVSTMFEAIDAYRGEKPAWEI